MNLRGGVEYSTSLIALMCVQITDAVEDDATWIAAAGGTVMLGRYDLSSKYIATP